MHVVAKKIMAVSRGSKAVELVTSGQHHAVASFIDHLELQVLTFTNVSSCTASTNLILLYAQQTTYSVELDQRPQLPTLQLLGHIYNGDL